MFRYVVYKNMLLPGWWKLNQCGHFSKSMIPNTQPRKRLVSEKEDKAARQAQQITWPEYNWKFREGIKLSLFIQEVFWSFLHQQRFLYGELHSFLLTIFNTFPCGIHMIIHNLWTWFVVDNLLPTSGENITISCKCIYLKT